MKKINKRAILLLGYGGEWLQCLNPKSEETAQVIRDYEENVNDLQIIRCRLLDERTCRKMQAVIKAAKRYYEIGSYETNRKLDDAVEKYEEGK